VAELIHRKYTIQMIRGGVRYCCDICDHTVTTMEFDPEKGNLRTQAAGAMNRHVKQEHKTVPIKLSDSQRER